MTDELFGRPIVQVEPQGEPIFLEVGGPMLNPNEHAFLAEQKGIIQCLECGHWTRDGLAVLRTVACHVDASDVLTPECLICHNPRQVQAGGREVGPND